MGGRAVAVTVFPFCGIAAPTHLAGDRELFFDMFRFTVGVILCSFDQDVIACVEFPGFRGIFAAFHDDVIGCVNNHIVAGGNMALLTGCLRVFGFCGLKVQRTAKVRGLFIFRRNFMHFIEFDIPFSGLHADIFACRDGAGIDGDIFGLHADAAACRDGIIVAMDLLFTGDITADAGSDIDFTVFSAHQDILTGFHRSAVIIDGAIGTHRNNALTGFDAAVHAAADVIDVAFRLDHNTLTSANHAVIVVHFSRVSDHVVIGVNHCRAGAFLHPGFHLFNGFGREVNHRHQHICAVNVLVNEPDNVLIQIGFLLIRQRFTHFQPHEGIITGLTGIVHQHLHQVGAFYPITHAEEGADGLVQLAADQFGDEVVVPNHHRRLSRVVAYLLKEVLRAEIVVLINQRCPGLIHRHDFAVRICFNSLIIAIAGIPLGRGGEHSWNVDKLRQRRQGTDAATQLFHFFQVNVDFIACINGVDFLFADFLHHDIFVFAGFDLDIVDAVIQAAAIVDKVPPGNNAAFITWQEILFLLFELFLTLTIKFCPITFQVSIIFCDPAFAKQPDHNIV